MRGEFIDLNGERLYYYAAGTRGAGEPVVLIHGFPASSHLWFDVVPKLPEGHRVIVVDLLGFGRSDAPPNADYDIASHGRRLIALLDALNVERACVVGHGTGGAIALWLVTHAASRVSRLGLVGSATVEGSLSRRHSIETHFWKWLLRAPASFWLPIARRLLARGFSDSARGSRSADLYLTPFATEAGSRLFRRQLVQLSDGQIEQLGREFASLSIPKLSVESEPLRFLPEEEPSMVADGIAKLLLAR